MRIPNFKDPELTKFLASWDKELQDNVNNMLTKNTANHSIILQSPSNKVYEITVNDAGVLVATLVAQAPP